MRNNRLVQSRAIALLSRFFTPAILLFSFLFVTMASETFALAGNVEMSGLYQILRSVAIVWLIVWWLRQDSRKQRVGLVLDMGMWLWMAWPLFMPYYLIRTRGRRAWLPMAAFVGLYVLAVAAGTALYLILF